MEEKMKRSLLVMSAVVVMAFMTSQAMACSACGWNGSSNTGWTGSGNTGGYTGDQYGGGYTNTYPNVNTTPNPSCMNLNCTDPYCSIHANVNTNTNTNANSSTDPNVYPNAVPNADYQNFLNDTVSLRQQLAEKQKEYVALLSQSQPDSKLAEQLSLQIAQLNSQIQDKALTYGLPACGYQGCSNHAGWGTNPGYQSFLNDTISMREQLAAKQGAYVALISQPKPNKKYAGKLFLEIAKLNNQIRSKATSYGLPVTGYYGGCNYSGGGIMGGGWGCNYSGGAMGGGWACW